MPAKVAPGSDTFPVLPVPDGLEVAACRRLIISSFDKENVRTMAAVKEYAEAHRGDAAAG